MRARAGQVLAGERGQKQVLEMGSESLGATLPDSGRAELISTGLQVGPEGSAEPRVQRGRIRGIAASSGQAAGWGSWGLKWRSW